MPISQCPIVDPQYNDPSGVPISAIIFGGRRSTTVPLVYEATNWQHGTFVGASVCSEQTAAAEGKVGEIRNDPFAMLPFCGYHMGKYFGHWLSIGEKAKDKSKLPKIFHVNWFKKRDGKFLWPGYGENSRVLKWMFERLEGADSAVRTPIGLIPKAGALDTTGLNVSKEAMDELFRIDNQEWAKEASNLATYFKSLDAPKPILQEADSLLKRCNNKSSV